MCTKFKITFSCLFPKFVNPNWNSFHITQCFCNAGMLLQPFFYPFLSWNALEFDIYFSMNQYHFILKLYFCSCYDHILSTFVAFIIFQFLVQIWTYWMNWVSNYIRGTSHTIKTSSCNFFWSFSCLHKMETLNLPPSWLLLLDI
jgi:hypothetical protein